MYYREALELQAFLDVANDKGTVFLFNVVYPYHLYLFCVKIFLVLFFLIPDFSEGFKAIEMHSENDSKTRRSYLTECQAIADMKFTYVVSCQNYGIHKRKGDPRAQDILKLMSRYPFVFFFGCCRRLICKHFV